MKNFYKSFVTNVFKKSGIIIGKDIIVKDERFYKKVFWGGSLAFGETYMQGLWDCDKLDDIIASLLKNRLDAKYKGLSWFKEVVHAFIVNKQNIKRAKQNILHHYDIGNDLYSLMLDKRMAYSCGYWKDAKNLEEAQEAKLDLICRKLGLKPGMKVLDIGCGWGSFSKFAAEKYGCEVTGVTLSHEQAEYAKKICAGLSVNIMEIDYRKIHDKFDRVLSIGMFEHVGPKNYKQYFKKVYSLLKDDGISLLHTIGTKRQKQVTEAFINKYIFPGSLLPARESIEKASKKFYIKDWHNFGTDYDLTLMAWNKNFEDNWDKLSGKYSNTFKRMWHYYLLSCAAAFRIENIFLWQVVLTKKDINYEKVR